MTPETTLNEKVLRDTLVERFDLEEFRDLCLSLSVNYDDLRGEGRSGKMRELVLTFVRRNRLRVLAEAMQEAQPDLILVPLDEAKHSGDATRQVFVAFVQLAGAGGEAGVLAQVPGIARVLSELRERREPPAPTAGGSDAAAAVGVAADRFLREPRSDGVALATYDEPAALLEHVVDIARAARRDGARFRAGLYSDLAKVAPGAAAPRDIPGEAVNLARRIMNLGDDGHVLASQLFAERFKTTEHERLFHPVGRYEVKPRVRIDLYNVFGGEPAVVAAQVASIGPAAPAAPAAVSDFGNMQTPQPKPPEQVLLKVRMPRGLRCSRRGRIKLEFAPHLAAVTTVFDYDNKNIRVTCNDQYEEENTFRFDFKGRADSYKQVLEIAPVQVQAESLELIRIYCYDENGDLTSPPVHRWLRLTPRIPRPESSYNPVLWALWVLDKVTCWSPYVLVILLAAALSLTFLLWRVAVPEETRRGISRVTDDVLIALGLAPERIEENWDDQVTLNVKGEWIERDDWEKERFGFQYTPVKAYNFDIGELIEEEDPDTPTPTPTPTPAENVDGALLITGEGFAVHKYKKLGTAFYDFDLIFRVRLGKGNVARWILRADPEDKCWYEFELKREGNLISINGYTQPGRESLKGNGNRINVQGCCNAEDEFRITARVEDFQFRYCLSVEPGSLKSGDDQTYHGRVREMEAIKDTRRFGRYRYGNVGVLGPGRENDYHLLYWQISKLGSLPFCTAEGQATEKGDQ
jgi:class 3 adenylate cyclase